MPNSWLDDLKGIVEDKPCPVLRLPDYEWDALQSTRRGATEFTLVRPHGALKDIRARTLCLILGTRTDRFRFSEDDATVALLGIVSSKAPVSTFDSRIKIKRAIEVTPSSVEALAALLPPKPHGNNFRRRLNGDDPIVMLSPKLCVALIYALAARAENRGSMRLLAATVSVPRVYRSNTAIQGDAIQTALRAFGLNKDAEALSLELVRGRDTALVQVPIMEDTVIEHDARDVPGFDLVDSDITGRAMFRRGEQYLEIVTANHRHLEQVFGVDLIYVNLTQRNVVMVQYKMLEPHKPKGAREVDWIYRPDRQLEEEIERMKRFAQMHPPAAGEYRLNPQVFYLKFVRRDAKLGRAAILTPLDHYERLVEDPTFAGPQGGLRISYEALAGRYISHKSFFDLIRAGYIGANAETTEHLRALISGTLSAGRSVVAAMQRGARASEAEDEEPQDDIDAQL